MWWHILRAAGKNVFTQLKTDSAFFVSFFFGLLCQPVFTSSRDKIAVVSQYVFLSLRWYFSFEISILNTCIIAAWWRHEGERHLTRSISSCKIPGDKMSKWHWNTQLIHASIAVLVMLSQF